MLSRPRLNQPCQLWYRAALRPIAPHHGAVGTVVVRAGGMKCRNHGVILADGTFTVVPAGNLRTPQAAVAMAIQGDLFGGTP